MIGLIYTSDNKFWFDTLVRNGYDNKIKSYRVHGDPHKIKIGWYECEICTKKDNIMLPHKYIKIIKFIQN